MSNTPIIDKETEVQNLSKFSIFEKLANSLSLEKSKMTNALPYLIICGALVIIYIANAHYHVKTLRKIKDTQKELKALQSEYVSLKAELAKKTKASEVAKSLQAEGLKELRTPPFIIEKEN